MARSLYLACYDIADPKRLRRVCRLLQGYRVEGQLSAYECWLTPSELRDVKVALTQLIDTEEDRVHLFRLDPRMSVQCYGQAKHFTGGPFLIV